MHRRTRCSDAGRYLEGGKVAITAGAALIGKSVLELFTAAASRECLLATKDTPDRAISNFFISFALLPKVPPLFLLTPLWPLFFCPPIFKFESAWGKESNLRSNAAVPIDRAVADILWN